MNSHFQHPTPWQFCHMKMLQDEACLDWNGHQWLNMHALQEWLSVLENLWTIKQPALWKNQSKCHIPYINRISKRDIPNFYLSIFKLANCIVHSKFQEISWTEKAMNKTISQNNALTNLFVMATASKQFPIRWEMATDNFVSACTYRIYFRKCETWKWIESVASVSTGISIYASQ